MILVFRHYEYKIDAFNNPLPHLGRHLGELKASADCLLVRVDPGMHLYSGSVKDESPGYNVLIDRLRVFNLRDAWFHFNARPLAAYNEEVDDSYPGA